MATTLDDIETRLNQIDNKLGTVCSLLTGNTNPHHGLIVRVDRLEQRAFRWGWLARSLHTAILAAIAAVIVVLLS